MNPKYPCLRTEDAISRLVGVFSLHTQLPVHL